MKHQPALSVIITALNEEKNVSPLLTLLKNFLETQKLNYEVIFVDDGSTDNTSAEAKKFSQWENLKVVKLPRNYGSGGAIKETLKYARGEWYAWLPCDLEILPEELKKPLEKRFNQDVVVTYFASGQEARSLLRQRLSHLFTIILNLTFGHKLPYYNGLSLVRRNLIDEKKILSNGFFFHAELLIRVLVRTKNIIFVPVHLSPREAEKTKAIKFKVFKDVIWCYLRTFWEVKFGHANSHH